MEVISEERVERYRWVLGLSSHATVDDLRRCYRREMHRWHPDLSGGDEERAKLINEARDYFTGHPNRIAAVRVKPNPQPRTSQQPHRTPPAPAAATRVAPDPVAEPPRWRPPSYSTPPGVAPVPQPVTVRRVADGVATVAVYGWVAVTGAIQLLGLLLIVCLVIYFVVLLGWLLATVIPWFLKVVGPIAWS